jgi:aminomethyltransferase
MKDKGIPRHGYPVVSTSGAPIGVVTSGTQPPFLGRPIAMAYVDKAHAEPGTEIDIEIRGRKTRGVIAKLPFYKRPK